jgi:hypothetical protein
MLQICELTPTITSSSGLSLLGMRANNDLTGTPNRRMQR